MRHTQSPSANGSPFGRKATSRGQDPEDGKSVTRQAGGQVDHGYMNDVRLAIERMVDATEDLVRFNHASIFEETRLHSKVSKLIEAFLPFHREILKPQVTLTIAARSTAITFVDVWISVVDAFETVRSEGVHSLYELMHGKLGSAARVITTIEEKVDRNCIRFDAVQGCCRNLKQTVELVLRDVRGLCETFDEQTEDSGSRYIASIRKYMKEFNDAFYSVFPRTGVMPMELSSMKADTMSACNDSITGIRSLFSFYADLKRISDNIVDVQKLLVPVFSSRKVMGFKTIARARTPVERVEKKEVDRSREIELDPLTVMINNFVAKAMTSLGKAVPKETLSMGERLDAVAREIVSSMAKKLEVKENDGNEQKDGEPARTRKYEGADDIEHALLLEEFDKAHDKIRAQQEELDHIREYYTDGHHAAQLERVGNHLSNCLSPMRDEIERDSPNPIVSKEEVSIFVVEKRCSTCKVYEDEAVKIKERLKQLVDFHPGESLQSIIEQLARKHEETSEQCTELAAVGKEHHMQLNELQDASNGVVQGIRDRLKEHGIDVDSETPEDTATTLMNAFNKLVEDQALEIENCAGNLKQEHLQEMDDVLSLVDMLSDGDTVGDGPRRGKPMKPSEVIEMIQEKVRKTKKNMKEMKQEIKRDNKLLGTVEEWLRSQAMDVNIEGMTAEEALHTLMRSLDTKANPLQAPLDRMKRQEQAIDQRVREFLLLGRQSGLLPETLDFSSMNVFEMLNMLDIWKTKSDEQVQDLRMRIESQLQELEANRDSLETIGIRLRRLLQRDDVALEGKDANELWFQVTSFVEELTSGGLSGHFMAIADINEITQQARKTSNISGNTPGKYLPTIAKMFESYTISSQAARKFAEPLEAIFKSFDFKLESYHPNTESFRFLREKIFQLNLLLGKQDFGTSDKSMPLIFKRFVSLNSMFLSFVAASFLQKEDQERMYNQALANQHL